MWIWKISTFSPDLAVTWGFWLSEFSLSISMHALWMCYNEQSLYLYLETKIWQNPSESNWISVKSIQHVSNQHVPKCLLIGMKQDSLPNVGRGTCHSIYFVVIFSPHQKETFSVWDVKECSFALHGIFYKTELKCFTLVLGFRLYPIPNANTTSGPILRDQSLLWGCIGAKDFLQSLKKKKKNIRSSFLLYVVF